MNADRRPAMAPRLSLLLPAAALFLASCDFDPPAAREENYVTVRLNDSLSRYDRVEVLILADGDTDAVIGKAWDGRLPEPGKIPSYRLGDDETRPVSIRVKGYDGTGRLVLDMRIAKRNGGQVVDNIALPKPSPALSALAVSPGALSPAFDPAVKEYALSLANHQNRLQVTMTPAYPQAIMSAGLARAYSGKASEPIDMRIGSNRIVLNVAAADTSAQYVINATRAQAPADTTDTTTVPPDTLPGTGPFAAWKHMALVSPDFTQADMVLDSDLTGFPILLRLTKSNFKLAEAARSGGDLRFTTLDQRELPHEISYWDEGSGSAGIWIKTDTLRGDGLTASFLMFWGNPSAAASSEPAKVFPEDAGWSGVWHLEEEGKGATGEYKDATGRFHGTASGKADPSRVEGAIGHAQDFKVLTLGRQAAISIPTAFDPGQSAWTMTFWAKQELLGSGVIFAKGDATAADKDRFQIFSQLGGRLGVQRAAGKMLTNAYVSPGAWCQVGIVKEAATAHFYIDGKKVETRSGSQGSDALAKVFLGALNAEGSDGYDGKLDEVWFSHTARSKDFIRLLFESQKPNSGMITILPQY